MTKNKIQTTAKKFNQFVAFEAIEYNFKDIHFSFSASCSLMSFLTETSHFITAI